jgi:hypothetical protein
LNRLRWQDDESKIKLRTLTDAVEREGNKIIDCIDLKEEGLLNENNYDTLTGRPIDISAVDPSVLFPAVPQIPKEIIYSTIEEYNLNKEPERQIDKTVVYVNLKVYHLQCNYPYF